ncbi:MAG: D-tyrosyl-tRNA(Tyr) deacylase [Armatimonadetes bacterium 55-13]|nr:D-tyrosyl-tRNA(Tyr) deacylase [Armatimonadota bacterium]OJU64940.1 MAG: D-tyrosyl-tRNA(Tyr) deacylase [Armatimonadetes bacterium 55-13]
MRAVVQRVSSASVTIDGVVFGKIGAGLLLLVGIHRDDTEADAKKLADRVVGMRIFNDENGKINLAVQAVGGSVLAISNFTVYGDASQRRPSFTQSAGFEVGSKLFDLFLAELRKQTIQVESGQFGADMQVELVNDGPVTLVVDTR